MKLTGIELCTDELKQERFAKQVLDAVGQLGEPKEAAEQAGGRRLHRHHHLHGEGATVVNFRRQGCYFLLHGAGASYGNSTATSPRRLAHRRGQQHACRITSWPETAADAVKVEWWRSMAMESKRRFCQHVWLLIVLTCDWKLDHIMIIERFNLARGLFFKFESLKESELFKKKILPKIRLYNSEIVR